MNEILEKLKLSKDKILSDERGTLYFFGLLERTDLENKWDIVISTSWLEKSNSEKDLIYIIDKLKSEFGNNLDFLSRIALFVSTEDFINDLGWALRSLEKERVNKVAEFFDLKISEDIAIRHLFVLECNFDGLDLHKPVEVIRNSNVVSDF